LTNCFKNIIINDMRQHCNKCDKWKDERRFSWRNKATTLRLLTCKSCVDKYSKTHYRNNKVDYLQRALQARHRNVSFIIEYKQKHPCIDCANTDVRVLSFDHLPGCNKTDNISKMVHNGASLKRLQIEIDKCVVRCFNCHGIKTYDRRLGV
jgi:hypothetical protein